MMKKRNKNAKKANGKREEEKLCGTFLFIVSKNNNNNAQQKFISLPHLAATVPVFLVVFRLARLSPPQTEAAR